MAYPIMTKATAVWLLDNTTITFRQIADFCGLHELEVQGIADGEVASGIKGLDPVANNQLEQDEIRRAEADPLHALALKPTPPSESQPERSGPRYTPLSKRQDKPAAIAWLVKFHPELTDGQISKLVGTTKSTITAIRERTHWNIGNIQPTDPVALGLCRQMELDSAVRRAARRKSEAGDVMTDEERMKLVSTEQSLHSGKEPRHPSGVSGLDSFVIGKGEVGGQDSGDILDVEKFFTLPSRAPDKGDGDPDEGDSDEGKPGPEEK